MSNIDKQALREAAEKATPGPWRYLKSTPFMDAEISAEKHTRVVNLLAGDVTADNSNFIAAANPATVLALLYELEAAEKRITELQSENEYIRKRFKEVDLLLGKNLLVMKAAIIEWQVTGDAKNGLAWIYNTLFGPGELPSEDEKDAQAWFDREYDPLDKELMELHRWFWEQSEAERAAAGIGKG
ncbi:hypothetical protein GTGU_04758, partial [Trabulsiella guamensis ATCC 49490]